MHPRLGESGNPGDAQCHVGYSLKRSGLLPVCVEEHVDFHFTGSPVVRDAVECVGLRKPFAVQRTRADCAIASRTHCPTAGRTPKNSLDSSSAARAWSCQSRVYLRSDAHSWARTRRPEHRFARPRPSTGWLNLGFCFDVAASINFANSTVSSIGVAGSGSCGATKSAPQPFRL